MPRSVATSVDNSFVKGLITEATGLNFPENASTETFNCVFEHTGEVSRRLGIDYESDFVLNDIPASTGNAIREFLWKAVAQNGEFTFVVIQIGNVLSFYSVEDTAISATKKSFTVDLDTYKVTGSPTVNDITCSFDSGNGYLFITHPYCEPIYVSYDSTSDTITSTSIDVRIRDFEGIEDTLEDDERPTVLTKEHHYNLLNQGWGVDVSCTSNLTNWTQGSPLENWRTAALYARADFPANADIWWSFKSIMRPVVNATGNVIVATPVEAFSMVEAQNADKTGNSRAPRGHYIFTAWNIDRAGVTYSVGDTQTSLTGIPVISSGYQRPSQVAFYASRVWYAGVNYNQYNNKIYFSKIIERTTDFGRCYQTNDPTTEKAADLLPSDGGFVIIPAIAKIVKMQQVGHALFIFATNGVWKIEGSSGIGFAANDYSVVKVSTIGAISDTSFVDVEGQPMWWNSDGIWTVNSDPTGTAAKVDSLSFTTIQTFIDQNVSNTNKRYVKGTYNPLEKVVQWLYRTTEATSVQQNYQYDGILNLSLINQSFYPWTNTSESNFLVGLVVVQGTSGISNTENVVDSLGAIVTTGAGNVTVNVSSSSEIVTLFKYLVVNNNQLTFAEFDNEDYLDWASDDEDIDFSSYFITGYKVHGDGIRKFQSNYTQIFTRNEVSSQFDFQSRWDYAISGNTGRWSNVQRVIVNNLNYDFRTKRLKNRGHGKVLQYKVTSVTGKPFNIIGWVSTESANSNA